MQNPLTALAIRGFEADFFGASPVASALDLRTGRNPAADQPDTNMHLFPARSKQDISTLQRIGHFYFALTWGLFFVVST